MVPSAELPDEQAGTAAATPAPRGRVRLRRAALMAIPACVAGGVLMALTAQGVLAAQFSISGMPFTVTASNLHGDGFEQYGDLDHMIKNSPNQGKTGGQVLVAVTALSSGTLTDLCQSVNLGGINMLLTAGDDGRKVEATNLVTDSDVMSGDANFKNLQVGIDASTLAVPGKPGVFGQRADTVDINKLYQHNWATTVGSFTLPHLNLSFSSKSCP
ncbi:DUF6230 family protein [Kitasatospora kifunensis]|uniref:Cholesterol esterase n=1 Tax=Kitasatospora kifunensis TaxID=58351 RepID=A0A7W7QZU5_KITKI|nr:DUF6230 family protein [Kitasatospora kifunensis]MBB4922564.1 hypothetical protein [Kitasatospora kifunensis]